MFEVVAVTLGCFDSTAGVEGTIAAFVVDNDEPFEPSWLLSLGRKVEILVWKKVEELLLLLLALE